MPNNAFNGQGTQLGNVPGFIPKLWSTEVKRQLERKLLAANYTKPISFVGVKGDTITVPLIRRVAVSNKLPGQPVNIQSGNETTYKITVGRHVESSFGIEDVVAVQTAVNLRGEYTKEAAYALRKDIDNAVLGLRAAVNAFPSQVVWSTATGVQNAAPIPLSEVAILAGKQILDEADVPEEDRVLIVSPSQYNALLLNQEFTSMDFVKNAATVTGQVGELYGMPVIKTTQIGLNSLTGYTNGDAGAPQPTPGVAGSPYLPTQDNFVGLPLTIGLAPVPCQTALMCHKEWAALAMQVMPKVEASRESLYLMDVVVNHQIYDCKLYRPDHAVLIHTAR
jgi:hypothetical protein